MRRSIARAAATVALVVLAGCTPHADEVVPPRDPAPAPGTPAASESPDERDYTPPPQDGSADPSTAGPLSSASLPRRPLGFEARVTTDEEGTDPNGDYVQAVDGEQGGREARVGCSADADAAWPAPTHALQASYGRGTWLGGGMALQFADAPAAEQWYRRYRDDVAACPTGSGDADGILALRSGADWMADQRYLAGSRWSEITRRQGARVMLVMVNDRGRAPMTQLVTAAKALPADG